MDKKGAKTHIFSPFFIAIKSGKRETKVSTAKDSLKTARCKFPLLPQILIKNNMKKPFKMSEMPSKKNLKTFINERLFGDAKVKRISTFNSFAIIFHVELKENEMHFCPSFAQIQSIQTYKNNSYIVYTINNDIYGYGSIISEIDYFRRNPESAKKRNLTVI